MLRNPHRPAVSPEEGLAEPLLSGRSSGGAGQRGHPVRCVSSSVWTHGTPSPGPVGEHRRAGAHDAGPRTVSFPLGRCGGPSQVLAALSMVVTGTVRGTLGTTLVSRPQAVGATSVIPIPTGDTDSGQSPACRRQQQDGWWPGAGRRAGGSHSTAPPRIRHRGWRRVWELFGVKV